MRRPEKLVMLINCFFSGNPNEKRESEVIIAEMMIDKDKDVVYDVLGGIHMMYRELNEGHPLSTYTELVILEHMLVALKPFMYSYYPKRLAQQLQQRALNLYTGKHDTNSNSNSELSAKSTANQGKEETILPSQGHSDAS